MIAAVVSLGRNPVKQLFLPAGICEEEGFIIQLLLPEKKRIIYPGSRPKRTRSFGL